MSELYSLLEDFREDYRHNPSFGSIILEDLYTSSGRIIILPIGGYLHILTFLSDRWLSCEEIEGLSGYNNFNTPLAQNTHLIPVHPNIRSCSFDEVVDCTFESNPSDEKGVMDMGMRLLVGGQGCGVW